MEEISGLILKEPSKWKSLREIERVVKAVIRESSGRRLTQKSVDILIKRSNLDDLVKGSIGALFLLEAADGREHFRSVLKDKDHITRGYGAYVLMVGLAEDLSIAELLREDSDIMQLLTEIAEKDPDSDVREITKSVLNVISRLLHYEKGSELVKQQKWQDAITELKEAVRLNPKHAKAHMALCMAYVGAMDFESARRHFVILKELDPVLAKRLEDSVAGAMILRGGPIV